MLLAFKGGVSVVVDLAIIAGRSVGFQWLSECVANWT
jgi:hypothetical protein